MFFFLRVEGREGVVVWVVRGEFRVLAYLDDGAALVAVEEFLAWHFWRIRLFLSYRVSCLCVAVCGLWGVFESRVRWCREVEVEAEGRVRRTRKR
jgi:hypothetical protein